MNYGWDWITDRIALGGAFQSPADVATLKTAGITHVINCVELCDPAYVEQAFAMCWPMPRQPDDGSPRTAPWFREGWVFWESHALDPKSKLYIHCEYGINRSASMTYYLLRKLGIQQADTHHIIAENRVLDLLGYFGSAILGLRYADEAEAAL